MDARDEHPTPPDEPPAPAAPRRPYHTPVLEDYGSIRDITRNVFFGMGLQDGAGGVFMNFFKTGA